MALDYFTVVCNGVTAIGIDYVDEDTSPDETPVFAFVEFRPRLAAGTIIWAPELGRGIQLDPVKARFSPEDGVLRTIVGEPLNAKQRITVTGTPFTLSFDGEGPTTDLADTATADQVKAALEALPNIETGDVFVSAAAGSFDVTFRNNLGYQPVATITATNATVSVLQEGTLDAGVKLVANTAAIELETLLYDVVFDVPESDRVLAAFAFVAPTTADAVVDLAAVEKYAPKPGL